MGEWAAAFSTTNTRLSKLLSEDRAAGFDAVERLGLPTVKRSTFGFVGDFLKDPQAHLDKLNVNRYFLVIPPTKPKLEKFRKNDLAQGEVEPFIRGNVPSTNFGDYSLIVGEYLDNKYGGSIIVNPDGRLIVEMIEGIQSPLSTGATPQYKVERDEFTGVFRYSDTFEDERLRRAVFRTISCIPPNYSKTFQDQPYNPGYYEFGLVTEKDSSFLKPKFWDYKNNSAYYL